MIYCLNFVKKNMEVFLNRHPHVREIPCSFLCIICLVRITPACAGNTQKKYQMTLTVWDHSHMCGKYYVESAGST